MKYDGIDNQLVKWQKIGILEGISNYNVMPKIAKWNDLDSYSLNDRARAWLDINCAHCHNKKGPANNTGLYLDYYETNLKALGINKTPELTRAPDTASEPPQNDCVNLIKFEKMIALK